MTAYRNAFITGASAGIGEALAVELARGGTEVALAARRREELDRVVERIRSAGGRAEVVVLDVADTQAVVREVKAKEAAWDGLDLVVANAGVSWPTPAAGVPWERVETLLQINVLGAIATLVGATAGMVERRRGHLVGISSLASYRGFPQNGAYCASKAALATYLESMRLDLRPYGISVTSIHPGFIRTAMTAKNKHPMPFLMDVESAASKILRAIERRKRTYAFPFPLAALVRTIRWFPAAIFDALVSRVRMGKMGAEE